MKNISIFLQVDKLEESEIARMEEKKEEEYKPVVMGKCAFPRYFPIKMQ